MKQKPQLLPHPEDICIGVVSDGKLNIGSGHLYEAPLKPGKYIVISFGNDSLLLTECTSESSQLLSEASRGTCLSGGPFHIQAHILRLSRIHAQNRNGKRNAEPSRHPQEHAQAHPGSQPRRKADKGCNSFPASSLTTSRYTPSACSGPRRNNTHSVFQKLVRAWSQNITKTKKHTGGKKE